MDCSCWCQKRSFLKIDKLGSNLLKVVLWNLVFPRRWKSQNGQKALKRVSSDLVEISAFMPQNPILESPRLFSPRFPPPRWETSLNQAMALNCRRSRIWRSGRSSPPTKTAKVQASASHELIIILNLDFSNDKCKNICIFTLQIYIFTQMSTNTKIFTYTCTFAYTFAYTSTFTYLHIIWYIHVYIRTCKYIYMCIRPCAWLCRTSFGIITAFATSFTYTSN